MIYNGAHIQAIITDRLALPFSIVNSMQVNPSEGKIEIVCGTTQDLLEFKKKKGKIPELEKELAKITEVGKVEIVVRVK
jgi:hypothetical protein